MPTTETSASMPLCAASANVTFARLSKAPTTTSVPVSFPVGTRSWARRTIAATTNSGTETTRSMNAAQGALPWPAASRNVTRSPTNTTATSA